MASGIVSGIFGSATCCCGLGALAGGAVAVRWTARATGEAVGPGRGLRLGLAVGIITGLLNASLGTLLFLAQVDDATLAESQALALELGLQGSGDVSMASVAGMFAVLALGSSVLLGLVGGALGAALLGRPEVARPQPRPLPTTPETPARPARAADEDAVLTLRSAHAVEREQSPQEDEDEEEPEGLD